MLLDTWPVRAKLEPKVHRTSLSEPYTFWDFGRRCTGALYRSRTPFAPGSEGVRVARLRPYTFWVFGQRCTGFPIGAVHLLGFRPKVCGFQSPGRSPSVVSAKGVWIPERGSFTFCDSGQRCAGCSIEAVHLLPLGAKVCGLPGCGRTPFGFSAKGARACGLDE